MHGSIVKLLDRMVTTARQRVADLEELRGFAQARASSDDGFLLGLLDELRGRVPLALPASAEVETPRPRKNPRRIRANRRPSDDGSSDRARRGAEARDAEPVAAGAGGPPPSRRAAKRPPRAPRPLDIPSGKKWCGTCEKVKPSSEFPKNTSMPDGLGIRCKPCSQEACKRWRDKQKTGQSLTTPTTTVRRAPVPGSGEATKRKALIAERMKAARAARRNDDDDEAPEMDFDGELPVSRELFG